MPQPIQYDAAHLDLSPRVVRSATVTASPAAAAETAICTTPAPGDLASTLGVILLGWFSITIGTNGVLLSYAIRRTNAAGTAIATNGTETVIATQVYGRSIVGFDTGPTLPGQVYVLTATVGSGSAPSTVSAAQLVAIVV